MNYLIRLRDGAQVGTVTTPLDPAVFAVEGEDIETFTDYDEFTQRLEELTPEKPSPLERRIAALERRLDRAAQAEVAGDAAKVRDGLRPGDDDG